MGADAKAAPLGGATSVGRRPLVMVSASHATQHVYSALLPLTYSYLLLAFHISYAELGLAVSATSIVGGLSQATAGYVSRRISPRWILGSQNLILGLCAVLGSLAPAYPLFAGAQGAAQLGASQQHPVGGAVLARTYPDRRGRVLSIHTIGGSIGSLVIPVPAALMISRLGWRPTLLVFSIPLFLMGVLLVFTFPRGHRPEREPGHAGGSRIPFREVFRSQLVNPRVVILGIVAATVAAGGRGLGTLNAYVPLFLRNRAHIPELEVGIIFDVMLLGAVVGPLVGGALSDRVGRLPVLWTAYCLAAALVFGFGLSAGLPLFAIVVLALLVGLFAYIENPLLQALVSDGVTSQGQASVFGAYFALAYGVGALWIALLGWAIQSFGFSVAFAIMAGSYLAAGAVLIPCWRSRPGTTPRAA